MAEAKVPAQDPWGAKELQSCGKTWAESTHRERCYCILQGFLKAVLISVLFYLFVLSLSFLTSAFRLLGGRTAGKVLQDNELLGNPVAGLVLGVLATVLLQSSSASTSIVVAMTAEGFLTVENAIPLIMGANIGTSVTNTIVSVAQIADRDEYRRAFAGATVHDCFNLLTVAVLFPIECASGLLRHVAQAVVESMHLEEKEDEDFLKAITKPATSRLIQVDTGVVTDIALGEGDPDASLIKQGRTKDNHLFMDTPLSDSGAGWLLLFVSLTFLLSCLVLFVKTLQTVFGKQSAAWVRALVNLEFKHVPFVADWILLAAGVGITILMQSSSITTSALTPLVGIGFIRLDKMFPLTVGANIGTTLTSMMAAFASNDIALGLEVAFSHLFFNIFGTAIWFLLPFMRSVPLGMAKVLGSLAAEFALFPFIYIGIVFGAIPAVLLGLSVAGVAYIAVFGTLLLLAFLFLFAVLVMRSCRPKALPKWLQKDPRWMPQALRVEPLPEQASLRTPSAEKAAVGVVDGFGHLPNEWFTAPVAWGSGWFALLLLFVSLPNAQWANVKYAKFDPRDHIGIGSSQACSAMFVTEQPWAPDRGLCSHETLEACARMPHCTEEADFAGQLGANALYEESWTNCSLRCSTMEWEAFCHKMQCTGKIHPLQCQNVSHSVTRNYWVTHGPVNERAWPGGDRCLPLSSVCSNHAAMGLVGEVAWIGTGLLAVGEALLVLYTFVATKRRRSYSGRHLVLPISELFLIAGSMTLLVSWAMFAHHLDDEVTCRVMAESMDGAIYANGKFRDIINGVGSYTFAAVIAAWVLSLVTILAVAMRGYCDLRRFGILREKEDGAEVHTREVALDSNDSPTSTLRGGQVPPNSLAVEDISVDLVKVPAAAALVPPNSLAVEHISVDLVKGPDEEIDSVPALHDRSYEVEKAPLPSVDEATRELDDWTPPGTPRVGKKAAYAFCLAWR